MRKLALTAVIAITAMAMTATTASAAISVTDAATGNPCSAVSPAINAGNANALSTTTTYSSGGCTVRMNSPAGAPIAIRYNDAGPAYTALCDMSYDAHIGPDGWGLANNFTYTGSGCGATTTACSGSRLIAPPEYNPAFLGGTTFRFANASTELNVTMCARILSATSWGLISVDVGPDGAGNTKWHNQQTAGYGFNYWRFIGGDWTDVLSPTDHPVITHL